MPENIFTAHATAAISNLVRLLPCATSQISRNTSKYHGHGIKPASKETKDGHVWFHLANPEVESSHCWVCTANLGKAARDQKHKETANIPSPK
jgi:hypothetical protein